MKRNNKKKIALSDAFAGVHHGMQNRESENKVNGGFIYARSEIKSAYTGEDGVPGRQAFGTYDL